jgi:hypothetical protein
MSWNMILIRVTHYVRFRNLRKSKGGKINLTTQTTTRTVVATLSAYVETKVTVVLQQILLQLP